MTYSNLIKPKVKNTPQTSKAKKGQTKNHGGGYSFKLDIWGRLDRFLILGSDSNSYYASAQKLTKKNVKALDKCIKADYTKTVDRIVEISDSGRAPKNDSAIFSLAYVAACDNVDARNYALSKVSKVCRIGTHLFQFVEEVDALRGWGRGLREGVASWYTDRKPDALAYQVAKYRNRHGWTHRDVLRKCHAKTGNRDLNRVLKYATGNLKPKTGLLAAVEEAKNADLKTTLKLIRDHGLTREMVSTEHLSNPKVQEAMLNRGMPLTAMIRNLGNMSKSGLLGPNSDAQVIVCNKLRDQEYILKSRIHPVALLIASSVYTSGQSFMGSGSWTVNSQVRDALDDAFNLAFGNIEVSGDRYMVSLDVSGSMDCNAGLNSPLRVREISAAMATSTIRTEDRVVVNAFTGGLTPLDFGKNVTARGIIDRTNRLPFDWTDCSLPMIYAANNKIPVDKFVIYTDNDTNSNTMHPHEALVKYRDKMGIDAKLVVAGVVANNFSIADPDDPGMLDIVGFDSSAPNLIAKF